MMEQLQVTPFELQFNPFYTFCFVTQHSEMWAKQLEAVHCNFAGILIVFSFLQVIKRNMDQLIFLFLYINIFLVGFWYVIYSTNKNIRIICTMQKYITWFIIICLSSVILTVLSMACFYRDTDKLTKKVYLTLFSCAIFIVGLIFSHFINCHLLEFMIYRRRVTGRTMCSN